MSDRFQKAQFASIIGMVANVILAIIKGIGGVLGDSRALIADALTLLLMSSVQSPYWSVSVPHKNHLIQNIPMDMVRLKTLLP